MQETYKPFNCANDALDKPARLRRMMGEDGYLFVKQIAPREKLLKLRQDVLKLCADAGWPCCAAPIAPGILSMSISQ